MIKAIIIYVVSMYAWWKYVNIAHSKGGIFEDDHGDIDPSTKRLLLIILFTPLINSIMSVIGWIGHYPKKREHRKSRIDFIKFFRIKF